MLIIPVISLVRLHIPKLVIKLRVVLVNDAVDGCVTGAPGGCVAVVFMFDEDELSEAEGIVILWVDDGEVFKGVKGW